MLTAFLFLISCKEDDQDVDLPVAQFNNEITNITTFGGSNFDTFRAVIITSDGGFAAFGITESIDHDVDFKHRAGADYILVKYNANLGVEWTKHYGGSGDDQAHDLVQTADGGFALVGYSQSADGDGSNNEGFHDNWIIKTDTQGNLEWEKSFGFVGHDHAYTILAFDDGYAIGGFLDVTASGGEGATRENTRHGVGEFWVHRLNLDGSIRWRKYFGGTHDDKIQGLAKGDNGSILLAGYTESQDFDVTNNKGGYDFWAIKLDANGDMVWENTYGGNEFDFCYSIAKNTNNEYLLTGSSLSASVDVNDNYGNADVWVVAINENGQLLWEQNYGGSGFDAGTEISPASDGGSWLVGNTRSNDIDISNLSGENDGFLLHLNDVGNLQHARTIGGSEFDFLLDVKEVSPTKVVVVGETGSSDGDLTENLGDRDAFIALVE